MSGQKLVYHGNEFLLTLPEGLKDKTVHIFSLTDEGPSDFSVVITRDRTKMGEDLDGYAEKHLAALLARLPLFRVLARSERELDRQRALVSDFTWQTPDGKMFQRQTMVYSKAHSEVLHVTATCRGEHLSARWESMLEELLKSFRLRA